jgi:hypothetical protein
MANLLGDLTKTLGGLGSVGGDLANLLNFSGLGDRSGYVQTPKLATSVYGLDLPALNQNIPFLKFEFFAHIYPNGDAAEYFASIFKESHWSGGFPLIKSVVIPSVDIDTKTLNEYNRNRISQTKLKFKPVKLVIHDAVNGITLNMWKAYYEYYFSDGNKKTDQVSDQVLNPSENFPTNKFGYNLAQVGNTKYLFDKIDIYQIHAKKVIQTTLYNPRISSFTHDTLDYSSNETVAITLEFDYEWIEYHTCASIEDDPNLLAFLGKSRPLEMNFNWKTPVAACKPPPEATSSGMLSGVVSSESSLDNVVGGFKTAAGMAQSALGVVRDVKKTAQVIVGKAASAASVWNQVQMDITGKDEPIIPAPKIRDVSAYVNQIPTGYSDIRRFSRNVLK